MGLQKFMICHHPFENDDSNLFIIHTEAPQFIAEVFQFDVNDNELINQKFAENKTGAMTEYGDSKYIIGLKLKLWSASFEQKSNKEQAITLAKKFREMADWLHQYFITMDELEDLDKQTLKN